MWITLNYIHLLRDIQHTHVNTENMEAEVQKETKCQHHHGKAIKRLRLDKGWSRVALADKIGVSEAALNRMEAKEELSEEILERVAKELGVSKELIKELEEDKPLAVYIQENNIQDSHSPYSSINNTVDTLDNRSSDSVAEMTKVCDCIRQEYDTLLAAQKEMMEYYKKEIEELREELKKERAQS